MIIPLVFKTVLGRWVTVSLVALLLGGGAWKWYSFKQGLVEEGTQLCVQEVNKETMLQLEEALVESEAAFELLLQHTEKISKENAASTIRRQELEASLDTLAADMRKQRNTDENYKEWSDTPLPDNVADRLRKQASGSDPGSVRDNKD